MILGLLIITCHTPSKIPSELVHALYSYYESTWLNGSFRLDMWNQFRVDMRTNNKCEGYNIRLAKRALKAKLILLFKEEQINKTRGRYRGTKTS